MEPTLQSLVLLPVALGLLGFIEPCTIGGHLVFLDTQKDRTAVERGRAVASFVAVRALVAGLFGGLIAFAGQRLIGVQTGFWLIFGGLYLLVGLAFLTGRSGRILPRISLAPETWKRARAPHVLGAAFGLNIPACAAPILFGLLGLSASVGSIAAGFAMMAIFGLALSAPLVLFAAVPALSARLAGLGDWLRSRRWVLGTIFVLLGAWSIWFGLYVDPADWAGARAGAG